MIEFTVSFYLFVSILNYNKTIYWCKNSYLDSESNYEISFFTKPNNLTHEQKIKILLDRIDFEYDYMCKKINPKFIKKISKTRNINAINNSKKLTLLYFKHQSKINKYINEHIRNSYNYYYEDKYTDRFAAILALINEDIIDSSQIKNQLRDLYNEYSKNKENFTKSKTFKKYQHLEDNYFTTEKENNQNPQCNIIKYMLNYVDLWKYTPENKPSEDKALEIFKGLNYYHKKYLVKQAKKNNYYYYKLFKQNMRQYDLHITIPGFINIMITTMLFILKDFD